MRNRILVWTTVIILGLAIIPAVPGRGQETQKAAPETKSEPETKAMSVYRLEFVIRELDGDRSINSRRYTLSVGAIRQQGKIRMGSSIPVQENGASYTNANVDVNIDCRLFEAENGLILDTVFELASFVAVQWKPPGPDVHPILRRFRLEGQSLVTPGKPTIVGKLDDVATNHTFEIEVTATKVK